MGEADPRLAEGWRIFRCVMAEVFPKWFQRPERIENPYMGGRMLACGSETDWSISETPDSRPKSERRDEPVPGDGDVAYYTCSMHPSVKEQGPGACPICNMDLIPVSREEVETGIVFVDAARRQTMGVRTGAVERKPMRLTIRAVGKIEYDETRLHDIALRTDGWIERLQVDAVGGRVERG